MYKIIIICENAINFSSMKEAKDLIRRERDITLNTGVKTMSKFQLFSEDEIVNPEHRDYCLKRMLSYDDAEELFLYGKELGQEVFFTCMYPDAVDICERIGVNYYKIRYFDRMNWKIHLAIAKTLKPTFISLDDNINYRYIMKESTFIPLLCVPKYPATVWDYFESVEPDFHERFKGVSDHTSTLELFIDGAEKGVEYWEKHVCLTKEGCLEAEWAVSLDSLESVLQQTTEEAK